jgi:biotin carboxyl carrier protein
MEASWAGRSAALAASLPNYMTYDVNIDGRNYRLELTRVDGGWECSLDGRRVEIDAILARRDVLSIIVGGKAYEIKRERTATDVHLWVGSIRHAVELRDPRSLRSRAGTDDGKGPRKLLAPMPGKVVRVLVNVDAEVEAGQGVVVVEAMKMQNEIKSPKKGVVRKMIATAGANVNAGDVLAVVE